MSKPKKKYSLGKIKASLFHNDDGRYSLALQTSYNKDDVWYNKPHCKKCGKDVDFSLFPNQVLDYIQLLNKIVEDEPEIFKAPTHSVFVEEL